MSETISYTAASFMDWHGDWGSEAAIRVGSGPYHSYMTRFTFTPQHPLRSITLSLYLTQTEIHPGHCTEASLYAAVTEDDAVSKPAAQLVWHWTLNNNRLSAVITMDVQLSAGKTCYLWLWGDLAPGGYAACGYNRTAGDNAQTVLTGETGGQCWIDGGSSFTAYLAYIDDGTAFRAYIPYRDTGTDWEVLT